MFGIACAGDTSPDGTAAIDRCLDQLAADLGGDPGFLMVHLSAGYDADAIRRRIAGRCPGTILHGGTSCLGAMCAQGLQSREGLGIACLGIVDPAGSYGSCSRPLGDSPRHAATEALAAALEEAGRPGEFPSLVWITIAPGQEEEAIAGLQDLVGPQVPVVGGTSADNAITGTWSQFCRRARHTDGMVVSALFPSVRSGAAFHSGYSQTAQHARVTSASGRTVRELDHRPAADVYDGWTGGVLGDLPRGVSSTILCRTNLSPLGREAGQIGGVPVFVLSHPETVTAERGLTLFTNVAVGDDLVLMTGSQETLVGRAAQVVQSAARIAEIDPGEISGGIITFCAGCMLAVRDRMGEVLDGLRAALPGRPFVGAFTYGEQGPAPSGCNRHGNLMISAVVFGSRADA